MNKTEVYNAEYNIEDAGLLRKIVKMVDLNGLDSV